MKSCFGQIKWIVILNVLIFLACSEKNTAQKPDENTELLEKNKQTHTSKTKLFHDTCIKTDYNKNNTFEKITSLLAANNQNNLYDTIHVSYYWEIYHEFIQISWQKLEQQRLSKIRKWREREIAFVDTLTHTVFYPFSGPDFLTVAVMFPKADTFILLGLEPVGVLPDFTRMSAQQQQNYLSAFCGSLGDIFNKSYFITKKMLRDFQSHKVNGLLPVLGFFIKKLNYNITDMKYIYQDSAQQIKEINYSSKTKQKIFGVKITATKDSCAKTVYYFRYNVMNKFFNDSTTFYHYLWKFKNYATYIKSASYLLHNSFMTSMRNMILRNSIVILQDDTGIPYKFLNDTQQWVLKLYGEYIKPIKDFGEMGYQPELAKRMKQDSGLIPKLPFHLGYHWRDKKDVLLLAFKKHYEPTR